MDLQCLCRSLIAGLQSYSQMNHMQVPRCKCTTLGLEEASKRKQRGGSHTEHMKDDAWNIDVQVVKAAWCFDLRVHHACTLQKLPQPCIL